MHDEAKKAITQAIFGIVAGIISYLLFSSRLSLLVLLIAIVSQKYIYPRFGTNINGAKDWVSLAFLTFCFWIVTWTLLLNA